MPYSRVNAGDTLYFLNNDAEGLVRAQAVVRNVFNSEALTDEESTRLIKDNQDALQLTDKQMKRWCGKRYLVLISVERVKEIEAFKVDKSAYGNMDDWLPVGDIHTVRL